MSEHLLASREGYVEPDPIADALELEMEIGAELYEIIQRLGARSDLLATFGSWSEGDLTAEEVLAYLKAYNCAERVEAEPELARCPCCNGRAHGRIPADEVAKTINDTTQGGR